MTTSSNEAFFPDSPAPSRAVVKLLAQSRQAWRSPGTPVVIAGRRIDCGMIYAGAPIRSINSQSTVEPSLIDPSLQVGAGDASSLFYGYYYWQNYSRLQPEARARYLDWLAAGRPAGALDEDVILFFGGIERRVFFDARYDLQARAEIPTLLGEVERLLRIYPESYALQNHASNFLVAVRMLMGRLELRGIEPPMRSDYWGLPMSLLVPLGTLVEQGQPIPAKWALSWFYCHPRTYLRTAAERCASEFRKLFRLHYQQAYGDGFVVKMTKRRFDPVYWPSNGSLGQTIQLRLERLPDVSHLQRPINQVQQIADMATNELADYSRALGLGWDRESCSALAFLPEALGDISSYPSVAALTRMFDEAIGLHPFAMASVARVLSHFPEFSARPTQKQATAMAGLVRRLGYGFDPDPDTERTAFNSAQSVALYRLGDERSKPRRSLEGPRAVLALCALVADATSPLTAQQFEAITGNLAQMYDLAPADVTRMRARMAWLAEQPPKLAAARAQARHLPTNQAQVTGRMLVEIASANSSMSPATIKVLSKLFLLLGLDEQQLHSNLHASSTRRRTRARVFEAGQTDFTIDSDELRAVQQQTDEVAGVLHAVFARERVSDAGEAPANSEANATSDPYVKLIEMLGRQSSWPMDEVEAMSASLGLMGAGAIETINDRALALGLEALLDCDDICDVHEPTLRRMLTEN